MKAISIAIFAFVCAHAGAEGPASQPLALPPLSAEQKQHQADEDAAARALTTSALAQEVKVLQASTKAYSAQHPDEWYAMGGVDAAKFFAYTGELTRRKDAKDAVAAFYWGVDHFETCEGFQKHLADMPNLKDMTSTCWAETLSALKTASAAGMASATYDIAIMYENGYGDIRSKFAAADWYVTAATQYVKAGDRDRALQATENALNDVPEHPAAGRLKKTLMK